MATIPLCFEFFRCRVDVLQSQFSRSTISIAVFCLQNLICLLVIFADQVFIDPTFFGIFVCSPLQSFVVNVCTTYIGNIFFFVFSLFYLITAPSKYPRNVRGVATKANELSITWDVSIETSMRYLSASQLIIVQ